MSTIEELLATEVEEQWEVDPRYVVNELYMDDDGPVEITGRDIGDVSNQSSIQGEAISQYVEFVMPRYYDNIDLSTKSLSIHYEMDEAGSEVAPINVYKSQDHIKFGWLVPANATLKEGILSFGVWARGYVGGEEYIWKSRTSSYRIEKSLIIGSGIPQPDEDWYLQFVRQMDGKVSQASQFADDAKKSQEAAQQSANTSQQASESAMENSAKASQSATAAKTSEDNAKVSEENARVSEQNAKQSELEAKSYAELAKPVASTTQGLNPTLENSTGAPIISFKGDGATEQQTYSGKNKLNTSGLTEVTKNGITFTPVYENGMLQYVNVNGTATDVTIYNFPISLENGNYILNGCDDGNSSTYVLTARLVINGVNHWINNFSDEKSFTVGDTVTEMSSYIQVYSGATVNNKKFYPMIRLATETDATYEPYVGGTASPNPNYKQRIGGIGDKGYFDGELLQGYYAKADGAFVPYTNTICNKNKIPCKSGDVIEVVYEEYEGVVSELIILFYDNNGTYISNVSSTNSSSIITNAPATAAYCCFDISTKTNALPINEAKHISVTINGKYCLSVKSTGKNKFDESRLLAVENWTFADGYYTGKCGTLYNSFNKNTGSFIENPKANTQYTISLIARCKENTSSNAQLRIYYTDGTQSNHLIAKTTTDARYTVITISGKTVEKATFIYTTTDTLYIKEFQVEEGAKATPYEPYTETTASIPLSAPLYEGDYIRYNMDVSGEEKHKIYSVVFDGSEKWGFQTSNGKNAFYNNTVPSAVKRYTDTVKCTHYTPQIGYWSSMPDKSCGFIGDVDYQFIIIDNDFSDVESFKAMLAEKKPTVVYELAEPTVTPLTSEQIAEFKKLRTFDGTTHITCEAESEIQYFYDSVSGKAVAMVVGMIKNK